jgi:hypothetical protein
VITALSYVMYSYLSNSSGIRGLTKVENYYHIEKATTENSQPNIIDGLRCGASLDALQDPGCGACRGTVYEKECYVDKSILIDDGKRYKIN